MSLPGARLAGDDDDDDDDDEGEKKRGAGEELALCGSLLACLLAGSTDGRGFCLLRMPRNVQSDNAETQGELVRRAWQRSGRRSCCCWEVGGGEVGRRVGRRGQQQRKRRFGNLVESGGGRTGAFGPLETVKGGGWDRRRRSSVSSEHLSSKAGRRSGFGWIWPGLAGHDPCGKLRWLSWRMEAAGAAARRRPGPLSYQFQVPMPVEAPLAGELEPALGTLPGSWLLHGQPRRPHTVPSTGAPSATKSGSPAPQDIQQCVAPATIQVPAAGTKVGS